MKKLQISDREAVDAYFRLKHWDTFYHYFPLIYAISESTEGLSIETYFHWIRDVLIDENELYFTPGLWMRPSNPHLEDYNKVWINTYKINLDGWRNELYDVNYIYDLEQTLKIKNFRKNVKKYYKNHDRHGEWYKLDGPDARALEVVKRWYSTSQRENFTDFGYTMWLLENFHLFPDLRARLLCYLDKPVGFSLWGKLTEDTGIHIISKDTGVPYTQDTLRALTYQEMKEAGLKYCNDGSDAGEHGIRVYKLKLRPKFIIPIYSWVKE